MKSRSADLGRQRARHSRQHLLSTGVICVLVRVCVRVSLVFWPVDESAWGCGRDALLFVRGAGRGYATRVSCDGRSFRGSSESTAWRRGREGVRCKCVLVCVARLVSLLFCLFWRVACSVCVIACAAGMRARIESARESCRARSFRVKRRARRVTSRP